MLFASAFAKTPQLMSSPPSPHIEKELNIVVTAACRKAPVSIMHLSYAALLSCSSSSLSLVQESE